MENFASQTQTQTTGKTDHTSVCNAVLTRIERENVQPRSRLFFQSRECVIWMVWFVALLLGAIAVAVTLYVSMSVPYTLYEATHSNLLTAFISALPYIWIMIFVLTAYMAIIHFRYTKHGYRYQTFTILGGSLFLSVIAGIGLQAVGGGYILDQTLGNWIAMYPSYEQQRVGLWQQPGQGRMIGTLVPLEEREDAAPEDQQFVFRDHDESVWDLDTSELDQGDVTLLREAGQQPVRVIGTTTDSGMFHVCGVYPWLSGGRLTRSELAETRESFMQTVQYYLDTTDAPTEGLQTEQDLPVITGQAIAPPRDVPEARGHCADIAAIRRAQRAIAP